MRADRLVATLLFLQAKGRATASEIAEELEVSTRTARRDLEALSMAGVPVYSTAGKGGGWSLVGGARTDLTGLSAAEARALMLVTGSAPSATPELKAAIRKLVQALPETLRADARATSEAVLVDTSRWGRPQREADDPPFLDVLQQAVVDGQKIVLGYHTPNKSPSVRVVAPLGLVAKAHIWYLVAETEDGERTFRVSRVTSVESTPEQVEKDPKFDLEETWGRLSRSFGERSAELTVTALASPGIMRPLLGILGHRVKVERTEENGWIRVLIAGPSAFLLGVDLAPFGGELEVLDPPEVRRELARIGAALVGLYGSGSGSPSRAVPSSTESTQSR